ncbi:MAG: sigma-70 family RNA polymerase sigma factor [Anaerohalosphaera sp.]|nr:sigma-70 family RNA polymerase sigma factor [Anaerohalosphaera sp.]
MMDELSKQARFFKLYNSVQTRLYSYLYTVVHNRNDAEDLLQETATILWDKFDQFQEGTNFGAWAVRIARNKALEFMRRNKKTRMIFDSDFYNQVSEHAKKSSSDVNARSNALLFCLEKLPDKSKELLSMRYKKELTIKRISQLMDRSTNGLYQTYSKIIEALRNCIDKHLAQQEI